MELIQAFISDNLLMIYILVFATFLGIEVISNVPTVLHTPLMSGSNFIHGIAKFLQAIFAVAYFDMWHVKIECIMRSVLKS